MITWYRRRRNPYRPAVLIVSAIATGFILTLTIGLALARGAAKHL